MSAILPQIHLVRHEDTLAWDLRGRVKPIPRSGFCEARAGLSWTGVREYSTSNGVLRVLRRRAQVEAPGHLRTLRRLPAPNGHPSGDRDVTAANFGELLAGYTGDAIDVEPYRDYYRPVGNVTIMRPDVFATMMSADEWRDYSHKYPEYAKGVVRGDGPARTGTSLGYNALWVSPTVEAEIVDDRDGQLVGAWESPNGQPIEYDVEHVVDPECELVQRLVVDDGFAADELGGQHFAINLPSLGGRGGEQSELLRVVDSRPIIADPTRGRVQAQVPRAIKSADMRWVVGASRELPLEEGDRAWDGDAAAASIFEGAGWPDNPDPAKAREGFLIYDADAPELKGSYKLPFARRGDDGRLRVPASGLRAAASFLPKTDAPKDVLERARAVVEHYQTKQERAQDSRDARHPEKTMNKLKLKLGVTDRAILSTLDALGMTAPAVHNLTLDEDTAAMVESAFAEMMDKLGDLAELASKLKGMVSEKEKVMTEMEDMASKMKDMPAIEAAQAKVQELVDKLAAAEKELASAKANEESMKKANDDLASKVQALNAELAPIRAAALADKRKEFVKLGLSEQTVNDCADELSLKRALLVAKVSKRHTDSSDDVIEAVFEGFTADRPAPASAAKPRQAADQGYTPGAGLRSLPQPSIVASAATDESDEGTDPAKSSKSTLAANCL